jgi:twinkle protein
VSEGSSELLFKTNCPACGSSDARAVYDDGHFHCFSAGCPEPHGWVDGHEQEDTPTRKPRRTPVSDELISGEIEPIPNRGLDDRTCEKFGYQVGRYNGKKCHIAPYYDETGRIVAQKLRFPGKDFTVLGDLKQALPLFGQQLCRDGGKLIVITEGEIDAMSVTQAMGLNWPAVSLPNGAQGAKKAISKALGFLEKFEKVVFLFDEDEHGRKALDDCLPLLTPGKAFVGKLPLKDANEMVKARRSKELVDAIWGARAYRPDAIVDLDDIIDEAAAEASWGLPWPWVTMTRNTYGIRRGALYVWGAGTGSGKTTLMKQLMVHAMRPDLGEDHAVLGLTSEPRKVASLFFEEQPKHTLKTLGGMAIRKRVHVPGTEYDRAAHREAMESFKGLYFPLALRSRDFEEVKSNIRYLVHAEGVRDFFIDPMTALVATVEDERRALDAMMCELAGLAEELDITIHLVSHLSTPEGKSHEDGGRIAEKHFRGSRSVAYWAHFMIGLERNKQDPACPTTFRGLKDRLTGDAVGPFIAVQYDRETGLMREVPLPTDDDAPFGDETDDDL